MSLYLCQLLDNSYLVLITDISQFKLPKSKRVVPKCLPAKEQVEVVRLKIFNFFFMLISSLNDLLCLGIMPFLQGARQDTSDVKIESGNEREKA